MCPRLSDADELLIDISMRVTSLEVGLRVFIGHDGQMESISSSIDGLPILLRDFIELIYPYKAPYC